MSDNLIEGCTDDKLNTVVKSKKEEKIKPDYSTFCKNDWERKILKGDQ